MFKKLLMIMAAAAAMQVMSGCAGKNDKSKAQESGFMQHDKLRTQNKSFSEIVNDFQSEKKESRNRYRDVSRPLDQEKIKVFPWRKNSGRRSEEVHEASRRGDSVIW